MSTLQIAATLLALALAANVFVSIRGLRGFEREGFIRPGAVDRYAAISAAAFVAIAPLGLIASALIGLFGGYSAPALLAITILACAGFASSVGWLVVLGPGYFAALRELLRRIAG